MSTFLERTWQEKVHSEDEVLNFIITWQPMKNYLQKFGISFFQYGKQKVGYKKCT